MWLATRPRVHTKIMIINADASMTVRLAGQLKRFGYSVTHFMKPTGAVDAVMNGRPDWLVLDIDQSLLNVVGFCELVHRALSMNKVRVLLCSSADESSAREFVRRCGARGFIAKDQPIESMAAKIDGFARKPQMMMMMPATEVQRLAAVRSYAILDTPPEEDFDSLTRRASHICGTPIALMSIIDRERQWFKSKVGITVTEMPRAIAFSQCDTLKTLSRQVMHLLELRQLRGMSERRLAGARSQAPLYPGDESSHQLWSHGHNRGGSGAR